MIKLEIEIDGRIIDAELVITGEDRGRTANLTAAGQSIAVELDEPEPGNFVLIHEQRVFRCIRERFGDGTERFIVNGDPIEVAVRDKKHRRHQETQASGPVQITSPMPGKIVNILIDAGSEVQSRQGVIIVEAMKMQNEIQSPRSGRVTAILVSVGQTVNAGEILATIATA